MSICAAHVPEIFAIVDRDFAGSTTKWIDILAALSDLPDLAGIAVQARAKSATNREWEKLASQARDAFQHREIPLFWNGDADIAAKLGFDGCHQPQNRISELTLNATDLIHGASIHEMSSLQRAQESNVDFVVFGPVFQPSWKSVQPQGLANLEQIATEAQVPVIAIGGIELIKTQLAMIAAA